MKHSNHILRKCQRISPVLWLYLVIGISIKTSAQQFQIVVDTSYSITTPIKTVQATDSSAALLQLQSWITELRSEGHLAASIDSIYSVVTFHRAKIFIGPQFVLGQINVDSVDVELLRKSRMNIELLEGKTLQPAILTKSIDKLLDVMANQGFPFAKARLQNIELSDGSLAAELRIDKQDYYQIDSIDYMGESPISKVFLHKYLDLNKGDTYSKKKILKIRDKIRNLPFLELNNAPTVTFFAPDAIINLDLKPKNASRFDFLIGLLPRTEDGVQKFGLAVDFTAEMNNKLGRGEAFFIQFRQLRPSTQELELNFSYPYLLDLPFGIDFGLEIFRNAEEHLDVDLDIGMQYFFSGNNSLKVFWNQKSSRLLEVDTSRILSTRMLPRQLDVKYTSAGINLKQNALDYRFNPRKGYAVNLTFSAGFKDIIKNQEILSLSDDVFDFESLYDTLNLNTFQFSLFNQMDYFIPLGLRSTIKTSMNTGMTLSKEKLFTNELHRIGGNKLLRGFDEQSILGSFYNVATVEYRLLIGQNSFISAFLDYGVVKNEAYESGWDRPYGIGAGMSFETGAGIFAINAAVGNQQSSGLDFRNAKLHFGFISIF